ncbi:MAG: hypothetical protein IPJ13_09265 [Saprospiraceae bacterium]|nr:hypothetical protein [Saprospiraceae bacterium]
MGKWKWGYGTVASDYIELDEITGIPMGPNQDINIAPIDWNSSNEAILKQVLIVLRMHYYYNNCLGGVTNYKTSIDWHRYFTNMTNSKTIPVTNTIVGGKTVYASLDFNFTLSSSPKPGYFSSVGVQHQGTTYGSGYAKESYDIFGTYSNAPLINIGVALGTDQNFISIIAKCR